ncbi:MAG: patatin-like phospholipase family protein [Janthinobacterium lividum]
MTTGKRSVVLVLSGGNALGAYQAGGYQALHDRNVRPDWVIGASTGAINGAIICGNPEEERLARLAEYWGLGAVPSGPVRAPWWNDIGEDLRRSVAVSTTMMIGQPNVFAPRPQPSTFWEPIGGVGGPSLYDTGPLGASLDRLADFDRLNTGIPRYSATAVDLETGEVVTFDTSKHAVGAEHVRASGALLPAFPPVEVDGRLLGDGGLAANLPIDTLLAEPPEGTTLCIALDLLPLRARRPRTLGEAASRMQDLMFASQSRRSLAAWQALYDQRPKDVTTAITLLHLSYDRQDAEVAGKAFDFSPKSVRERWDAGYRDVTAALASVDDGSIAIGQPGLLVWRPSTDR